METAILDASRSTKTLRPPLKATSHLFSSDYILLFPTMRVIGYHLMVFYTPPT